MMQDHQGEITLILKDLKSESEAVMQKLKEMENLLATMNEGVKVGTLGSELLLADIQDLRDKIGVIERVDAKEENEEVAADNLIEKLKRMIDMCI